MRTDRFLVITPILLLILVNCDSRDRGRDLTSDDVPVTHTSQTPQVDGQLFDLSLDLELGIDDGEPEWQIFAFVTHALVAPDGRMVIADRRRREIYIVNPDGTLQSRAGGGGEGPGEFQSIWGLMWSEWGEEFWVQDMNLFRFNRFAMDGEFLKSQHYGRQEELYDFFLSIGDRRFLGFTFGDSTDDLPSRYTFIDEELRVIEDFIEVSPPQMWKDVKLGGIGAIPYTELDGVAVFPDGRILSYHPYIPQLTIYDSAGDPVRHIQHGWDLPRVTAEEKERFRSNFRDNPGNAHFAHWATDMPIPDRHAAFDLVIPDDQDRIWVRRVIPGNSDDEKPEGVFDVFTSEGVWLGSQNLPHRPVAVQGDFVYCLYSAESGSPRFGRFRLSPN